LGVLIGVIVAGDGRSNWYKGIQLMLVYVMIAILFYFLPEATP
jgi:Ca2+:H+ antiporter